MASKRGVWAVAGRLATSNARRRINLYSRRADVLRTLSGLEHLLRGRGIAALHLFGSVARREDGPESDVDLAFVVDDGVHFFSLFDQAAVMNDLAAALGRRVDLVELTSLSGEMRQRVEREWIAIFV